MKSKKAWAVLIGNRLDLNMIFKSDQEAVTYKHLSFKKADEGKKREIKRITITWED